MGRKRNRERRKEKGAAQQQHATGRFVKLGPDSATVKIRQSERKRLKPAERRSYYLPYPIPLIKSNRVKTKQDGSPSLDDKDVSWPLATPGWLLFKGVINSDLGCVEIIDQPAVRLLFNMGFFGHGSLSRHAPTFDLLPATAEDLFRPLKRAKGEVEEEDEFGAQKEDDDQSGSSGESDFFSGSDHGGAGSSSDWDETDITPNVVAQQLPSSSKDQAPRRISYTEVVSASESLQMAFEEAFFLAYALGSLQVFPLKSSTSDISLTELWKLFGTLRGEEKGQLQFAVSYAVYHYYRSLGWVVKPGLKFGSDYLLYEEGPVFTHGLFSVTIIACDKDWNILNKEDESRLDWKYLMAAYRVTHSVAKELILCYVQVPQDPDLTNPECIQQFAIRSVLMSRFIPSKFCSGKQ